MLKVVPGAYLIAAAVLGSSLLFADVVILNDGKMFEGEVTDKGDTIEVKTPFGALTFKKEAVKKVVKSPAEMTADAATCHRLSRGVFDEAMKIEGNPKARNNKLRAAAELLEKALQIYREAREIFSGPEHENLDKEIASVIQELRVYRDKMETDNAPPAMTVPPAPGQTAASNAQPPDLLPPPPLPPAVTFKLEGAIEGESLEVVNCTAGAATPQKRAAAWPGPWSNETQLWWHGGKPGDRLKLRFKSEESGRKTLVLGLIKSFDYGIFKITINGKTVAPALDLYASTISPAGESLYAADLKAGANDLELEIVGSNLSAKSSTPDLRPCMLGLDYLMIRPAGWKPAAAGTPLASGAPAGKAPPAAAGNGTPTPTSLSEADRLLDEAKKAIEKKQYTTARTSLDRILKQHADESAATEAKTLLESIPHPDGRLVCGFDKSEDLKAWRVIRGPRPITFDLSTIPGEFKEGSGAAKLSLGKDNEYATGAIVKDFDKFDEKRFRGVSLWIYQKSPSPGRLEVAFIRPKQGQLPWADRYSRNELGSCYQATIPLGFTGWQQIKLPMAQFQQRGGSGGKIAWSEVGAIVLYDSSRKGIDILLDSLRFIEADAK
jgi:hypothetical protein